jgi:putative intracellular protease/amidase
MSSASDMDLYIRRQDAINHNAELGIPEIRPTKQIERYAAIIAAANYTTVRLRYVETLDPAKDPRPQILAAPAVQFFLKAMKNTQIVKAAPCHALWLLTPSLDALRGRHVTCNPVVLADVLNAGAEYHGFSTDVDARDQVWKDHDLVTNTGWHASELLVETVKNIIVENQKSGPPR